jgi:hypothetical protein
MRIPYNSRATLNLPRESSPNQFSLICASLSVPPHKIALRRLFSPQPILHFTLRTTHSPRGRVGLCGWEHLCLRLRLEGGPILSHTHTPYSRTFSTGRTHSAAANGGLTIMCAAGGLETNTAASTEALSSVECFDGNSWCRARACICCACTCCLFITRTSAPY